MFRATGQLAGDGEASTRQNLHAGPERPRGQSHGKRPPRRVRPTAAFRQQHSDSSSHTVAVTQRPPNRCCVRRAACVPTVRSSLVLVGDFEAYFSRPFANVWCWLLCNEAWVRFSRTVGCHNADSFLRIGVIMNISPTGGLWPQQTTPPAAPSGVSAGTESGDRDADGRDFTDRRSDQSPSRNSRDSKTDSPADGAPPTEPHAAGSATARTDVDSPGSGRPLASLDVRV